MAHQQSKQPTESASVQPPQPHAGSQHTPSPPTPTAASLRLDNSTRRIGKATYVPLIAPVDPALEGRAVLKFGFVRQLSLQPGEVDAARSQIATAGTVSDKTPGLGPKSSLWHLLRSFEGSPMPSQLPSQNVFAKIPPATLLHFGKVIAGLRQQALVGHQKQADPSGAAPTLLDSANSLANPANGAMLIAFHGALAATKSFEANVTATPVGMLNLERLEMTPAGIERGELLATIPLAPKEKTAVVQKEWSVTTKDFTSIVTDSLQNYSETGVTENTELAQATKSESDHSSQLNVNASVTGTYAFVTATAATQFGSQDKDSASAEESRKQAVSTTRKASARVKQEHKVTISTTTVTGTSETTTRILENPSDTNPMRIDYFSMMRKWHVRLYRYGLRLTYDIAIPEPGGALRKVYSDLANLQAQGRQSFSDFFTVKHGDIGSQSYTGLAEKYGAQVPPPPDASPRTFQVGGPVPNLGNDTAWRFYQLSFDVPDGYQISSVFLHSMIGNLGQASRRFSLFDVEGDPWEGDLQSNGNTGQIPVQDLTNKFGFLAKATGHQTINYRFIFVDTASVVFDITVVPTQERFAQWQAGAWNALYNAAQTQYYAEQQAINSQIQLLQDKINGVDTLTLRREEQEELMKGVLRWLLGPSFDFMPKNVSDLFQASGGDLVHGVSFTGNELGLKATDWTTMFQYQEMVKFINEAIEWENLLYFPYSYFWDVPLSWEFIRGIRHPDPTRQAFLRAGGARVVLPVRKGYEMAWMSFTELGDFGNSLPPGHPYMTIAQQIQDYDTTNYPGIPPANPAGGSVPNVDDSVGAVSNVKVAPSAKPVTITVDSSKEFIVGNKVIIDTFDSNVQESQVVTAVPDETHVTVNMLKNAHNGTTTPFPVIQPGERGVLISEWFEYTPSSGTDIAVTSNLATIA